MSRPADHWAIVQPHQCVTTARCDHSKNSYRSPNQLLTDVAVEITAPADYQSVGA